MDDVVDWLNKNSGAVQAMATAILVVVTAFYVILTWSISKNAGKQAEASVRMAEEMRRSREDGSRPVLHIRRIEPVELGQGLEAIREGLREWPNGDRVLCKVKNIGKGPALNIKADVATDDGATQEEMGTLGVGDEAERKPFAVIQDRESFIEVHYQDVYRRRFFSRRPVTFDEAGTHLGSLETGEEQTSDDS